MCKVVNLREMKRCFVMFAFFVLMLLLAALTDNSREVVLNDNIVQSELAKDNQLTNEIVLDDSLKN